MSSKLYRYQAKSIDGMLSQLIRYVANGGHYFYIRVRVPEGKDTTAIAERLVARYDIRKARWQRKRRHLKDTASIHLLQYQEVIVRQAREVLPRSPQHRAGHPQDRAQAIRLFHSLLVFGARAALQGLRAAR